jgi:hypothetical protein
MNIFEGSRRIAKLIGACIAIGFLFVGITDRIESVSEHLLNMVGSLAGLCFFTWAVGWIVRGFLGIPRGMDQKATS